VWVGVKEGEVVGAGRWAAGGVVGAAAGQYNWLSGGSGTGQNGWQDERTDFPRAMHPGLVKGSCAE
jgi:hypothetical protein